MGFSLTDTGPVVCHAPWRGFHRGYRKCRVDQPPGIRENPYGDRPGHKGDHASSKEGQLLVNALEQEKTASRARQTVDRLLRPDLVIRDEPSYLAFSAPVSSSQPVRASVNTSLVTPGMTTALPDRLIQHCHVLEGGHDTYRFRASTAAPQNSTRAGFPDRPPLKSCPPTPEGAGLYGKSTPL